jgi:pimeloyl-ACP methyl ester carboxylesterase
MKKIVYIHGLNSSCKIFNYIISCLPEHENVLVNYQSSLPLEDSYAATLKRIPKTQEVFIVGHSLGGILASLISARNKNLSVSGIVTISTPFGGSDHAKLLKWVYPSFKIFSDITPKSPAIKEIQGSQIANTLSLISTGGSLNVMAGKNDGVVTVQSQRMSPAAKKIEVDSNHFEILQDEKTVREIKKFIFRDK